MFIKKAIKGSLLLKNIKLFNFGQLQQGQTLLSKTSLTQKQNNQFSSIKYVRGFRNTHALEIAPGYLPKHTNPKVPPYNLVTEQVTGPQGFTGEASSGGPLRCWIYKRERSIKVGKYEESANQPFLNVQYKNPTPNPIRIKGLENPTKPTDFVQGLLPFADNDHILHYQYAFNQSMKDNNRVFHNCDGEFLIQPSVGKLEILTECGILELEPGIIGVITKNIKFQVNLQKGTEFASGCITELKNDRSLRLPHKGPLGANGLANTEYFETPVPYVDVQNLDVKHRVYCKMQNQFFEADMANSPFDVYAWKGNYAPYRFNFEDFVPIIAGQRDHVDPSSHIVLAVGGFDGGNLVELVVFAPRFNVTTDKYPTYLPPYDHRNNGKSEIMHYLGGYDARKGTGAGSQTLHDMGVAHGNDQETFNKSRSVDQKNVPIYLNHQFATMLELTNPVRLAPRVLEEQDQEYGDQLRGGTNSATQQSRSKESYLGVNKRITITAFERSVVPIFDVLMPNPIIAFNEKTGLKTRSYINSSGNLITVNSQEDQNKFWEVYLSQNPINDLQLKRNPQEASDKDILQVYHTMKSFFNRGTVIQTLDFETDDPLKTAQYYKLRGFKNGIDEYSVSLEENAPFSFRFIPKEVLKNIKPNEKAQVSTIDHTVINIYGQSLDLMFQIFPDTFWGGDPRDLRAEGVQFYTRVLTNDIKNNHQLVPCNNLDPTEEQLLRRIQAGDSYVPPYLKNAALGNQISRGLFDTNRTAPVASHNSFCQHVAMAVNSKYGDISYHLKNFQSKGIQLIPGPPKSYYELSEIDLVQRLLLPTLFQLLGIDAFSLPYLLFNGLLKPKDADFGRLNQILSVDCKLTPEKTEFIVNSFRQIQPVLKLVADQCLTFNASTFKPQLESCLKQQKINYQPKDVDFMIELIKFNRRKLQSAQDAGSLIDFQIIGTREDSGYLDQTFSVPITQKTEGTTGIFLEFIVRTCYDELPSLIKSQKLSEQVTQKKSCGAFGQGNFGNLMLGQQRGIKQVDNQLAAIKKQQGFIFQLPLLDLNTIKNDPLEHMNQRIKECREKGQTEKVDQMSKLAENIHNLVEECRKRKVWK